MLRGMYGNHQGVANGGRPGRCLATGLAGVVMHIEDRFKQAAAVVTVLSVQHSFPLAQISPQFGLGPKVDRWEKTDRRGTCYAVALAEALGIGKETITELILGAFLHDVGKIGIPDQILLKPGRLTREEFQVMQTHAVLGIEIVEGNPWLAGAEKTIRQP